MLSALCILQTASRMFFFSSLCPVSLGRSEWSWLIISVCLFVALSKVCHSWVIRCITMSLLSSICQVIVKFYNTSFLIKDVKYLFIILRRGRKLFLMDTPYTQKLKRFILSTAHHIQINSVYFITECLIAFHLNIYILTVMSLQRVNDNDSPQLLLGNLYDFSKT